MIAATFPKKQPTVSFRIGLAMDPWETVHEMTGLAHGMINGGDKYPMTLMFEQAVETEGAVRLTLAHTVTNLDLRVIAVDHAGKEITSGRSESSGNGLVNQLSVYFLGKTVADLEGYRVQVRPYHWVEFRNVSLYPQQFSRVEIEHEDVEKKSDAKEP